MPPLQLLDSRLTSLRRLQAFLRRGLHLLIIGGICVASMTLPVHADAKPAARTAVTLVPPPFMGVAYSSSGRYDKYMRASSRDVSADFKLLSAMTGRIRTYAVVPEMTTMLAQARRHGLKVTFGFWLGHEPRANAREIARGLAAIAQYKDIIDRIIVGNEVMHRGDMTPEKLQSHIRHVRKGVAAMRWKGASPEIGTADTPDQWTDFPAIAEPCDFVAVNMLPFWDKVGVDDAANHLARRMADLQRAFPTKKMVISETGWPSAGETNGGAVPSPAAQAKYIDAFVSLARTQRYDYYLLEAFDQPWKTRDEGEVGARWGLMDVERRLKVPLPGMEQAENVRRAAVVR